MGRRAPTIPEPRHKNEVNCTSGLFSIFESCQTRTTGRKLISNGRPTNKHVTDYRRNTHQLASFDQECRRIQNEAELASATVDTSSGSARNSFRANIPIEKHETKQNTVTGQHTRMDPELVDRLLKAQRRARKKSQKSYVLNNAASSIHELPSTSAEMSLNKLTLAAILGAVYTQNPQEDGMLSECFQRGINLGKYDQVDDEIDMQQVKASAKAFIDQMFIHREFVSKEETTFESKSFSDAFEVLSSNKDLFMELLPDPNSLLARRIKNLQPSQTKKETIKSLIDASSSEEPGSTFRSQKGQMDNNLRQKIKYRCQYSTTASFVAQSSDKIVILKPAVTENMKRSENVACYCSSMESCENLSKRISDAKSSSFSFRGMKKKLKHTFGVTRKEPSQFSVVSTPDKLSYERLRISDEYIGGGVKIKNSLYSSTSAETERNLCKKEDLKLDRGSDIGCMTETVRKKLDFSSVGFSNKEEFDVILEAKRHLSARLRNVNVSENVTERKSVKTLGRILSSPEHDLWPRPRRDGQSCSDSAQMRFCLSNTCTDSSSQMLDDGNRACLSPLRTNTEVASSDYYIKYDRASQRINTKTTSLVSSIDDEADNTEISAMDDGELSFVETSSSSQPKTHISEVPSELCMIDTIELQNDDKKTMMHSVMDSHSDNETFKCQEERRSPVSVLEPFFTEDANSPPSITLQSARKQLKPLRLDFEECPFESLPQDQPNSEDSYMEDQDHIAQYVHLVLQASCLNWDQLSEIRSLPEEEEEELIHPSLFDEEFMPSDCYFDPKLVFDHMNEVLLHMHKRHFSSPPWLVAFQKPKIGDESLAEALLDEIMREAEFYLLPSTKKRTLDQIVSKDVADCRLWLDVRFDTEEIVVQVSDDVLEESLLDILIEFLT